MILLDKITRQTKNSLQNVVIVGAGEAGYLIHKSILELNEKSYRVIGFLDDDPLKKMQKINGKKVIGRICDLERVVSKYDIKEVFIALPSGSSEVISQILKRCEAICIPVRIVPPSFAHENTSTSTVSIKSLREIKAEDLLNRDTYSLDFDEQRKSYKDKTVLVTGAAGSVGSQLCRDLIKIAPKRIIMVDNRESELFDLYNNLVSMHHLCPLELIIADIRDRGRMFSIFQKNKPDIIFHAAAYKHVPLMEIAPCESVKTNIRGTRIVLEAAKEAGCQNFILVSTDKAIDPINVMGASKRIAEQLTLNFGKTEKMKCGVVRFGNVLGSNGSVLPLFEDQIKKGGPITVTAPEVNRYFISIEEASALLLSVPLHLENGGKIFLLDMGEPVKILDLAKKMLTLRGLRPDTDIKIKFCGLRTGEKISEKLIGKNEKLSKSYNKHIYIVNSLRKSSKPIFIDLKTAEQIENTAINNDYDSLYKIFSKLFPTFEEQNKPQAATFSPKENRISPFSMNSEMEREFSYLFSSDIVHSREDAFLLALFKAGLEPINFESAHYLTSAKLNWQEIEQKAKKHQIGALIYYHLKPYLYKLDLPKDCMESFQKMYDRTAAFNKHIYRDIEDLCREFNKQKVDFILLKGALLLATVYNYKPIRTVGDIDILVREKDVRIAEQIVSELGYKPIFDDDKVIALYDQNHHHLVPYLKKVNSNPSVIEIHRDLVPLPSVLGFSEDDIWGKAITIMIGDVEVKSLSLEQMIHYLCVHGLFTDAKIKLRQILDISQVIKHYNETIDWQKFNNISKNSISSKTIYIALNLVKEMCAAPINFDYATKFTLLDKKLIKLLRRAVFNDTKLLQPALVQLLLLQGLSKRIMLKKIVSPHPFHQLNPEDYSSNKWQQIRHIILSSAISFFGLFKKERT